MFLCICVRLDMSRYTNSSNVGGSGGEPRNVLGPQRKKYSSECCGACSTCEREEKFLQVITGHCGGKRSRGRSRLRWR